MLVRARYRIWSLVLLFLGTTSSWGQPPAATEEPKESQSSAKLEFFQRELSRLVLTPADDPHGPCEFVRSPLIKFENPISQILDGFMFVWTDRGRPVAVVKSYNNVPNKSWGRTFVSIASEPLRMTMHDRDLWTPREPGVSFAALPDAPPPAEQPAQRLIQMRNFARRFQIIDNWGIKDPKDWQLRLLTTPLHRYEVPDEQVFDGALFGYSLTTAPEALVLFEARTTPTGPVWFYAVARCTRFGVRFQLDDKPLAEFPRLDAWPATGTYFHHPIPMGKFPYETADGK